MLQNARVPALTVSELLRENYQGEGGGVKLPALTQIRVKSMCSFCYFHIYLFKKVSLVFVSHMKTITMYLGNFFSLPYSLR